jgi:hypothetical protein
VLYSFGSSVSLPLKTRLLMLLLLILGLLWRGCSFDERQNGRATERAEPSRRRVEPLYGVEARAACAKLV